MTKASSGRNVWYQYFSTYLIIAMWFSSFLNNYFRVHFVVDTLAGGFKPQSHFKEGPAPCGPIVTRWENSDHRFCKIVLVSRSELKVRPSSVSKFSLVTKKSICPILSSLENTVKWGRNFVSLLYVEFTQRLARWVLSTSHCVSDIALYVRYSFSFTEARKTLYFLSRVCYSDHSSHL